MAFGFSDKARARPAVDLSVVIPLYNHERYVGAAIESVLRQTVAPREIICIDDGSSDGSVGVVEALARRHPQIRFWSRPNRGANQTINEGIGAAAGRWVAILNSDDLFHPARLARCVDALEAGGDAAIAATGISFIDAETRRIENPWYEGACAYHRETGDLGLALAHANFLMTTSNIVASRALFAEAGGFDDLRYAHDLDFFLRLVVLGKKVALVRERLLDYRMHGSNTIAEGQEKVRIEWAAAIAFFARRLAGAKDPGLRGPGYLSRLLDIADRHQLTRMLALILLQTQRASVDSPGALLADPAFVSALRGDPQLQPRAVGA